MPNNNIINFLKSKMKKMKKMHKGLHPGAKKKASKGKKVASPKKKMSRGM